MNRRCTRAIIMVDGCVLAFSTRRIQRSNKIYMALSLALVRLQRGWILGMRCFWREWWTPDLMPHVLGSYACIATSLSFKLPHTRNPSPLRHLCILLDPFRRPHPLNAHVTWMHTTVNLKTNTTQSSTHHQTFLRVRYKPYTNIRQNRPAGHV
jgi:hypothetical protein